MRRIAIGVDIGGTKTAAAAVAGDGPPRDQPAGVRSAVTAPSPDMPNLKHEQLQHHLVELIERELSPHDRLPNERELADSMAVSRMTVRRALDQLEREGRVYRRRGAGTFVAAQPIMKTLELTSFSDDMRRRGMKPGSRLLRCEEQAAGGRIGLRLGLSPTDSVVCIDRVRTADGTPMCLERTVVPSTVAPGLSEVTIDGSLYDVLESRYRVKIERAEQAMRGEVLEPAEAELLGVPPFSAALVVERVTLDATGTPVEFAVSTYRADRYTFQLTLHRTPVGS